ncbi:MAG: rhomboid family intramembrane serine protease [Bacteroidales bacterium]|nr:rhomboid family intramembrane serine protease [Lentimicrobiaceae bacterium]MDG1136403.1 rhomboid family intramembrane serine protease [Bacteroidales bacterium]|tara:strand:+ start:500 stop:1162 length:663 start_codon:yes stop_codon:yes gene_type:complete
MSNDKKRFILSLIVPIILLFVMYAVKIVEIGFNISLTYLGNYPISLKGLQGILLMPFIHGSWDHLLANTVPFFILCTALFYFYQKISFRVLIGIWILSGIWVWFGGRPSWHIGASGIIYGLSSFIFVSGLVRRDNRMAALALIVTFLYGSLVWGVFPDFYPREKNVSWEGHLGGAVAGLIMAIYYRNSGPKRKIYSWELEEEEDDVEPEDSYWKTTDTSI